VNDTGGQPMVATAPRDDDRPGVTLTRAPRLRIVLGLSMAEARLLARSPLVLGGLLVGGIVTWLFIHQFEPLWWNVSWRIGGGQLVLGMAVLVAAQLAAGRPRRDGLADLYASFPAPAATRTLAHLGSLAGALPAGLLLIGAVTAVAQVRGAIGTPDATVLAGGLLLVIAAGAAGIAIGARFPHPLAGVLGALALFLSSGTTHLASGAANWLVPWEMVQDQLGQLPGPLTGYPPARAHALELAGLAAIAGIAALALTVRQARARGGLAMAGIVAVAAICFAGALQLRPIPTADLNHLASEIVHPASAQACTTASRVRYCLYPGFGPLLPSLEAPVSGVLAHLPAQPAQPLTIRQVVMLSVPDSTFTHGLPQREASQWNAQVQQAATNAIAAPPSAISLPIGAWPATGGQLADAHFDLALAAAEWAVHLPGTGNVRGSAGAFLPCVPLDQAREAVAIWLAILATHPSARELQAGLGSGTNIQGADVAGTIIRTWNYPGTGLGAIAPPGGGTQATAAGYLLANAMTSLPAQKVSHVLARAWGRWLNWRTADAQLAAALGIPMPSVSSRETLPSGKTTASGPANGPQSPVCTT
jgi:hypothetical protein